MNNFLKRTWAEIDLNAIENNYRAIRDAVNRDAGVMCVVKADAYGHGAAFVAPCLQNLGADWFAVSNIEEAQHLRSCGIEKPILILGYTPPQEVSLLHALDVSQAVLSEEYAKALSSQAESEGVAVRAHVKFDTGMGRIGLFYQNPERDGTAIDEAERICRLKGLRAEGIFTHFAVADEAEEGKAFTLAQYAAFSNAIEQLEARGIHFEYRHCCNSAGIIDYPEMHMNLVRPGIILYGLAPSGKLKGKLPLKPAMELKSVISHIKHVEAQTSVSYGRTYITDGSAEIATVPVGYADGYQRNLSGKAFMQVCGKRAPIVGRVCMDQLMLDVSDIPEAAVGMPVTVFGSGDVPGPSADELAELSGTINYEITCMVSKRVPRIYYKDGKMVGQLNLICPQI